MKLTAFDQKSILYASLLEWSKKAIFTEHECSCEYCDANILICPNCEAGNVERKEEWIVGGANHSHIPAYICSDCGQEGLTRSSKFQVDEILKNLIKKHE